MAPYLARDKLEDYMKLYLDIAERMTDPLFRRLFEQKTAFSVMLPFVIEEIIPIFRVVNSDGVNYLHDKEDKRYKLFSSSTGIVNVSESYTKGKGREDFESNMNHFVRSNNIDYFILADISKNPVELFITDVSSVRGKVKFSDLL